MKIYIAGKITGDPDYLDKFENVRMGIRHAAKVAFRDEEGFILSSQISVLNPSDLPSGMAPEDYMRICIAMIDSADAVIFQPSYRESRGAQVELMYCDYIGKPYGVLPDNWEAVAWV